MSPVWAGLALLAWLAVLPAAFYAGWLGMRAWDSRRERDRVEAARRARLIAAFTGPDTKGRWQ